MISFTSFECTSLAAEFRTFCSLSRRCLGQPETESEKSALQSSNLDRTKAIDTITSVFVESTERRC